MDNAKRRHDGDRNALWFFIIAIISTCTITIQNGLFAQSAAELTNKLRSLSFRAILRQDGMCFPTHVCYREADMAYS